MDPVYYSAPNPFPVELKKELPYPTSPWLVSQEVFKRLASAPEVDNKPYKKIELQPDDPEAMEWLAGAAGHNRSDIDAEGWIQHPSEPLEAIVRADRRAIR